MKYIDKKKGYTYTYLSHMYINTSTTTNYLRVEIKE